MNNFTVWILVIIILLVSADKIITVFNIKAVEKNFPSTNKYSIEKNPIAKFFFKKYGLTGGTILYGIFSIITFIIALKLIEWSLSLFHLTNSFSIALWIMMIIYGFVILNNLFFLLKFSKVVP